MPTEFKLLGATLLLALAQIFLAGSARTRQYGRDWNMGARDAAMPPLAPLPARLLRAQANLFETLPLFIGAVLAAAVAGRLGTKTLIGAHLYFWGRLIYVPLYAAGVPAGAHDRVVDRHGGAAAGYRRADARLSRWQSGAPVATSPACPPSSSS